MKKDLSEKTVFDEMLVVASLTIGALTAIVLTANDAIINTVQDFQKFDGYVYNNNLLKNSIKYGLKVGSCVSLASFGLLKSYFFLRDYSKNNQKDLNN